MARGSAESLVVETQIWAWNIVRVVDGRLHDGRARLDAVGYVEPRGRQFRNAPSFGTQPRVSLEKIYNQPRGPRKLEPAVTPKKACKSAEPFWKEGLGRREGRRKRRHERGLREYIKWIYDLCGINLPVVFLRNREGEYIE